jgi:hypothetical protein
LCIEDSIEIDDEEDFRSLMISLRTSLTNGPVLIDRTQSGDTFKEFVNAARMFVPGYVARACLPSFDEDNRMIGGTFPDPTLNGVFPQITQWRLASLLGASTPDSDTNSLPDLWETEYLGGTGKDPNADPDKDGVNNLLEYELGSDPTGRGAPAWWSNQGVLSANSPVANDFAAINQGQIKWMAAKACAEMQTVFAEQGGAGSNVMALVQGFTADNNYMAVNIGQLKAVAKPFYDRLIELGKASTYTWVNAAQTNDFGAANIGQAKHLFSFDLSN